MKFPLWLQRIAFIVLGGAGGFAYYYFIGCQTGTCPITSNPYISVAYGALISGVLTFGKRSPKGTSAPRAD